MEATTIDEPIRVAAAFDARRAFPMWFVWRNRRYKIERVCFTWSSNQGISRLHHYSVTDGDNTYELLFDSNTLEWTLSKVCAG